MLRAVFRLPAIASRRAPYRATLGRSRAQNIYMSPAAATWSRAAQWREFTATSALVDSHDEVADDAVNEGGAQVAHKEVEEYHVSNFAISEDARFLLKKQNIEVLFPIQAMTFNALFEGQDLIGRSKTGTGKTLSFALPVMEKLREEGKVSRKGRRLPLVVALAPTRELAKQVANEFAMIAPSSKCTCIYGGMPYAQQEEELARGVDVLIGTPGRIIDHIDRGNLSFDDIETAILDEADTMLSFGFMKEVETIMGHLPKQRQTIMFSATMPPWVKKIAQKHMTNPAIVDLITNDSMKTAQNVKHVAMAYPSRDKGTTTQIIRDLADKYVEERAIVFTQTVNDCEYFSTRPEMADDVAVLHGQMTQHHREKALRGFRNGQYKMLIATDVAARGIDIPEVDVVIQVGLPQNTEQYIHRSGRTGRAGKSGIAILMYPHKEGREVRELESKTGIEFEMPGTIQAFEGVEPALNKIFRRIENIGEAELKPFIAYSEKMAEEYGDRALPMALARIMGVDSSSKGRLFRPRSLLTGESDFVTFFYNGGKKKSNNPIGAMIGELIYQLKKTIGPTDHDWNDAIGDVSPVKKQGYCQHYVFDLAGPAARKVIAVLNESENSGAIPFTPVSTLPKLQPRVDRASGRQGKSNGRVGRPWGSHSGPGGRHSRGSGRSNDYGDSRARRGDDWGNGRGRKGNSWSDDRGRRGNSWSDDSGRGRSDKKNFGPHRAPRRNKY